MSLRVLLRYSSSRLLPVLVAGLALLLSPSLLGQISGQLSNFDVHNDDGRDMTNLELDLRNVNPSDVAGYYDGPNAWGIPPIVRDIGGTEVTWADFRQPLGPGLMRHFGLRVDPNAPVPCGVQAYWTQHVKVIEIPVPWQTWRAEPERVIDVIRLNEQFAEPVLIMRERARADYRVPLNDLNWDNPSIPWEPVVGDPVLLRPGEVVELPIEVFLGDQAVYVRYTVALERNPDNVLTRFVNEAEIVVEPIDQFPSIVGSLSNFDAHNDTGKPVHDLELDILNVTPADVLDWYRGPNAWGLHPVTDDPSIQPIPGGTDVTWVDEWNPLEFCETRHFGLRLNPNTPEPLVRAYWTRVVKVWQIPVPWQWWQTVPGDLVRDVIQLSDTFDEPVIVRREWATMAMRIPLDDLTWDNPGIPWIPDPAGPVLLEPGDQTPLDIRPEPGDQAVYVRYSVTRESGDQPETRFVNEAEIDFGPTDQPQIVGTLSNFDVINFSNRNVTNLELDIRNIRPDQILDWYRGQMAWGLHPVTRAPVIAALPQTEVTWADFRDPLPFCETRHFGLELNADTPAPCGVQAYWTQHLKIAEIPVPWQTWRPEPDRVIDVIRLDVDFPEAVWIEREFARADFRVPLDDLNWDNSSIPWQPVLGDPVLLSPGDVVELPVDVFPGDLSVFVRYSVVTEGNRDNLLTRFVNEAEVDFPPVDQIPSIVGTLSNFDAHNDTGKPVHDLELDIRNIRPEDVWDWYRGPNAWGIDPVIRLLPDGLTAEVTWIDDANPIPNSQTRHFGLRLNPETPEPLVRAFWTREVKVAQIPVPWQFWVVPPGPFVRDVVQLSDTFISPVIIRREFALTDELVPLDQLNWDLDALWQPDPARSIVLDPGFQADLDIEVDRSRDAAVLVRYEVELPDAGAVVTRFVNEAMLGPGVVSGLHFPAPYTQKEALRWNASPMSGAVFDVVRGRLSDMHATQGIHNALCVGEDIAVPEWSDSETPPEEEGFYWLVRLQAPDGTHGTYDTTTDPVLREGRDTEIGGGDCL